MRDCCTGGTISLENRTGFNLEWVGAGTLPGTEIIAAFTAGRRSLYCRTGDVLEVIEVITSWVRSIEMNLPKQTQ